MAYVPFTGVSEEYKKEAEQEGKGFISRAISGAGESISKWAKGAVQGAQEVIQEGNVLAEENPLALTGTPMEKGITNAPAPEQTEEQRAAYEQYKGATGAFGGETLEPVIAPLAVAATFPVAGPALGAVGTAAQILLAPTMIRDIGQMYEKGGLGEVAKGVTYGGAEEFLSQPDLGQQFYNNPVATTASGLLSVAPALAIGGGVASGIAKGTARGIVERTQRRQAELTSAEYGSLGENLPTAKQGEIQPVSDYAKNIVEQNKQPEYSIENQSVEPSAQIIIPDEQGYASGAIKPAIGEYKNTVTKQEIIRDINDLIQTRTGRIEQPQFEGIYKTKKDVIRAREYGDFDVYAHEIGHYLDKQLKLSGDDAELINAADTLWGKNKTYQDYSPEQRRAEGVAEFTRQYLLNPEQAKTNFPEYYKAFDSALKENKKLSSSVDNIGEKMRAWYSQPAEARARGSVSFSNEEHASIVEKGKSIAYKLREQWIDDKVGLSKLTSEIEKELGVRLSFEENPYKQARMAQSVSTLASELMVMDKNPTLVLDTLNKLYDGKVKYAVTMRDILNGIDGKTLSAKYPNYLKETGIESFDKAFSSLLVAKRQLELQRETPTYKGPMSKADAERIVSTAPKELQDASKKFYEYSDNLLSIAENAGLIKPEIVKAIREKYKEYAPMNRDFSDESTMLDTFGSGKKIGGVSNPLKKITEEGSARTVINPVETMIKNTYMIMSAAERNKVAQTFIELDKKVGIGRLVEKVPGDTGDPKKSIFTVMVNGEKQAFQTTPEFYRAIMAMNPPTFNAFVSLFKPFSQALRVGATTTPMFMLRNMIKDTLTAGILSETGFKPVLDTFRGIKELAKGKEKAYEYKISGAPLSAFVGLDRPGLNAVLTKMGGGDGWKNYKPVQIANGIYEGFRKASELTESSTRMGEFLKARERGKGIREAGYLAKEITLDFSKSGSIGRQVNQVIPFFNAVLQGGDRFIRAMHENPARTTAFALQYITIPSIVLWLANHDEEWYKEMSDDNKNSSWLIKTGDTILRIPKPFEPGILFGSGIERTLDALMDKEPDTMKQWAKYAVDNFTPGLMPAAVGPIIEWITNYNFFRNKPIVGKAEEKLTDEMQFNAYTSEMAKHLGKITGTSPMKIDNTIKGYTASLGQTLIGTYDYLTGKITGEEKQLPSKNIPETFFSGITTTPMKNPKSVELFYEKLDKAEKEYTTYGEKGKKPTDLKKLEAAKKKISDLQKENRAITTGNKNPDEKRSLIDANNEKIIDIAQAFKGQ